MMVLFKPESLQEIYLTNFQQKGMPFLLPPQALPELGNVTFLSFFFLPISWILFIYYYVGEKQKSTKILDVISCINYYEDTKGW